jgi:hypothetical protein
MSSYNIDKIHITRIPSQNDELTLRSSCSHILKAGPLGLMAIVALSCLSNFVCVHLKYLSHFNKFLALALNLYL